MHTAAHVSVTQTLLRLPLPQRTEVSQRFCCVYPCPSAHKCHRDFAVSTPAPAHASFTEILLRLPLPRRTCCSLQDGGQCGQQGRRRQPQHALVDERNEVVVLAHDAAHHGVLVQVPAGVCV